MSAGIDRLASELQRVLDEKDSKKKTPYDTEAEVVRVDVDTVWVKIPGGVDETPAQKTINAKVGDRVQVRVSGGRAFLVGNGTNPPTDDTKANEASYQAQNAEVHAVNAEGAAADAMKSAETARIDASIAHQMAENATEEAATAHAAATSASESAAVADTNAKQAIADAAAAQTAANTAESNAQTAITNASAAQEAAATAEANAQTAITNASAAQEAAATAEANAQTAITNATNAASAASNAQADANIANSSASAALNQLGVVEDVVGVLNWVSTHATYKVSTDTSVEQGKLYFTKNGDVYTPVSNPSGDPSANNYYEIDDVTEAVSSYVSSHLSLTNDGLWVLNDSNAYKILLASDGMNVYDSSGNLVATFGQSITFNSHLVPQYIGGENAYIVFNNTTGEMTIGGSKLDISGNVTIGGNTRSLSQVLYDMQAEIDGSIESWYYSGAPTISNLPASNWTTDAQKNQHLRDLYFDTDTGKTYRWAYENNAYSWIQIEDTEASAALALAQQAKDSADSKLANVTIEYAKSTSPTVQPSTGWSTETPEWEEGMYIWQRTGKTINGTTSYTYTCIQGAQGVDGRRGGIILKTTTAPSAYTTTIDGFKPSFRIALATVKTQSGSDDVFIGDVIEYSYYHYPVGYVDDTYVYTTARQSIRGATGGKGAKGDKGNPGPEANVVISVTAIDYTAGTATLAATLYVNGVEVGSETSKTYQWYKDGVSIAEATSATYSITSASDLEALYSCAITW